MLELVTITSGATVLVNMSDPAMPGVLVFLGPVTPGVGFAVAFSAAYPTASGSLVYTIINP